MRDRFALGTLLSHGKEVNAVRMTNFLNANYRAGKELPMFIVRIVVVRWQQLEKFVPYNDSPRWSRAVRAFVRQPDMYFCDGIFLGHLCYRSNAVRENSLVPDLSGNRKGSSQDHHGLSGT